MSAPLAKQRGTYTGSRRATTKVELAQVRALRAKGLIVVQSAQALGLGKRTVYSYLKTTKA